MLFEETMVVSFSKLHCTTWVHREAIEIFKHGSITSSRRTAEQSLVSRAPKVSGWGAAAVEQQTTIGINDALIGQRMEQ